MRTLRKEADPSNAFKDALLLRIVGSPAPRMAFRFAVVGACVIILVFGMGTGAYAYGSPDVVEGHPFYFLKQGLENAEERLATTPDARAQYHAKMMTRRMSEAERIAENQQKVGALLENAATELDLSVEEIQSNLKNSQNRRMLIERLDEQNDRYENMMMRVPMREGAMRPLPRPEAMRQRLNEISP
ncbi:hypothetical protein A2348_01560 [Candidatus Uhrbacteria bacterium RIFOXYB12_FULL_58_10]|nr:MAG: hypothetical protein A2348_01560 [Candidatus Uhrbacteria bacterium RIFOXYB12_FULL_58_10]OGL99689.1 MAG: hypothetical protein A2501_00425 [Candidatus Uhrbacteria bacterium RIFOXYC12_FULL_57_11]